LTDFENLLLFGKEINYKFMHELQKKLLKLSETEDLGKMSFRQIGKLIGEESAQKIKHHLLQLEKKGFISMNKEMGFLKKTDSDIAKKTGLIALPILGCADCGVATQYAEERVSGYLKVSKKLLPRGKNNLFAIEAVGFSMNMANINGKSLDDGDFAIVDGDCKVPVSGDYVLSVIDGVANIKKFINDKENNQIVLVSESTKDYQNIHIHPDEATDYLINGKVVDVIKKPKVS
jgi:SOS-response transcriptional repressor LexA